MSGFEEPNYTQTPNSFFDKLMLEIDTITEMKVTLSIIRQTMGYHRDEDELSLSRLQDLTGMRRQSVVEGINRALERGSVVRRKVGNSFAYRMNMVVRNADQSNTGASGTESGPQMVRKPYQQVVRKPDPQKKVRKKEKESKGVIPPDVGITPPRGDPDASPESVEGEGRKKEKVMRIMKPGQYGVKRLMEKLAVAKHEGRVKAAVGDRDRKYYGQRYAAYSDEKDAEGNDAYPLDFLEDVLDEIVAGACGERGKPCLLGFDTAVQTVEAMRSGIPVEDIREPDYPRNGRQRRENAPSRARRTSGRVQDRSDSLEAYYAANPGLEEAFERLERGGG